MCQQGTREGDEFGGEIAVCCCCIATVIAAIVAAAKAFILGVSGYEGGDGLLEDWTVGGVHR